MDGKSVPFSEEAERGVLGSLLLDPGSVFDMCVIKGVGAASFYVPAHRLIFTAIADMSMGSIAIDLLTVGQTLADRKQIESIGGEQVLDGLIDATPTPAHAEYYIDIVAQKALLRSMISTAIETHRLCLSCEGDAVQLLGDVEEMFLQIRGEDSNTEVMFGELVRGEVEKIERLLGGERVPAGLATGFADIDALLLGLAPSNMYILAARPSMGKTSLAMNIAENIATGRNTGSIGPKPVGVFSLEMDKEALTRRMICSRAGISSYKLSQGFCHKQDELMQACSVLGRSEIFIDDASNLDVLDLRSRARRMKRKHNVQLIVIDYLQFLRSDRTAKHGKQIETAEISSQLKGMAKELGIPVLVLSQLSRSPEQRDRLGIPKLWDLRDSGAIEQDADVVMFLRRPCKYPEDPAHKDDTLATVDIAKHRNGPTGFVQLHFMDEFMRFGNRAGGVVTTKMVEAADAVGTPVVGDVE